MTIVIDKLIPKLIKDFNIHAYLLKINNANTVKITNKLNTLCQEYQGLNALEIAELLRVRDIYKRSGVDPSHTRCSQEALIRRAIKNNLPSINPIVDIGNIASIETKASVCVADYDKLGDNIYITQGQKGERINAIKRNSINLEGLIIYKSGDKIFGSTTSDSDDTKITNETKTIFFMVTSFLTIDNLDNYLMALFKEYLDLREIKKIETIEN